MTLKKLELQVPENLLIILGDTSKDVHREALKRLVLSLVQDGQISASKGAELLGLTYYEMLDLMGEHKVPVMNYSAEDLRKEVKALKKLLR